MCAFGEVVKSVGRISRQFGDLDQGVFIIEFEGDMVPDAEAMQKAGIPNGKCARLSGGEKNGQAERFLIDRDNRAAQQSGLCRCGWEDDMHRQGIGED